MQPVDKLLPRVDPLPAGELWVDFQAVSKGRAGRLVLGGGHGAEAAVGGDERRPLADAQRLRVVCVDGAAEELEGCARLDLDAVHDQAADQGRPAGHFEPVQAHTTDEVAPEPPRPARRAAAGDPHVLDAASHDVTAGAPQVDLATLVLPRGVAEEDPVIVEVRRHQAVLHAPGKPHSIPLDGSRLLQGTASHQESGLGCQDGVTRVAAGEQDGNALARAYKVEHVRDKFLVEGIQHVADSSASEGGLRLGARERAASVRPKLSVMRKFGLSRSYPSRQGLGANTYLQPVLGENEVSPGK
eukprot:scaffold29147_cov63-Phaeocystis_antarctica.AAC.5